MKWWWWWWLEIWNRLVFRCTAVQCRDFVLRTHISSKTVPWVSVTANAWQMYERKKCLVKLRPLGSEYANNVMLDYLIVVDNLVFVCNRFVLCFFATSLWWIKGVILFSIRHPSEPTYGIGYFVDVRRLEKRACFRRLLNVDIDIWTITPCTEKNNVLRGILARALVTA